MMPSFSKNLFSLSLLALAITVGSVSWAQTPEPTKPAADASAAKESKKGPKSPKASKPGKTPKEGKPKATGKPESGTQGVGSLGFLDLILPVGRSSEKVTVPQTNERGELTTLARAAKVTRQTESAFALEALKVLTFDPALGEEAPPVMLLDVDQGIYHRDTASLVSDHPCKIVRPQFVLTGNSMTFFQNEKLGQMKGKVKMIFRGPAKEKANSEASSTSSPSSTPAGAVESEAAKSKNTQSSQ